MSDPDFTCSACGGELIEVGVINQRKRYDCSKCAKNPCYECVICHKPRAVFGITGKVCVACITLNLPKVTDVQTQVLERLYSLPSPEK